MSTLTIGIPRPTHPTGLWSWITTIDHKRIGILYGVTAFIMFITGGIEATLMRLQLAGPEQDIVSAAVYNQLFTMHGTTMIFVAIMPLGAAFFNFVIPVHHFTGMTKLKKSRGMTKYHPTFFTRLFNILYRNLMS